MRNLKSAMMAWTLSAAIAPAMAQRLPVPPQAHEYIKVTVFRLGPVVFDKDDRARIPISTNVLEYIPNGTCNFGGDIMECFVHGFEIYFFSEDESPELRCVAESTLLGDRYAPGGALVEKKTPYQLFKFRLPGKRGEYLRVQTMYQKSKRPSTVYTKCEYKDQLVFHYKVDILFPNLPPAAPVLKSPSTPEVPVPTDAWPAKL